MPSRVLTLKSQLFVWRDSLPDSHMVVAGPSRGDWREMQGGEGGSILGTRTALLLQPKPHHTGSWTEQHSQRGANFFFSVWQLIVGTRQTKKTQEGQIKNKASSVAFSIIKEDKCESYNVVSYSMSLDEGTACYLGLLLATAE